MAMKPRGYHTGPRKRGLVTEPHRYIWGVYWRFKLRNKKPHHKKVDFQYYEEAERRFYEDKFTSNK
jgi:hypothetical protein